MPSLTYDEFSSLLSSAIHTPEGEMLSYVLDSQPCILRLYKITVMLIENAKRFNLTSITEPSEIIRKHITDSLLPLEFMRSRGMLSHPCKLCDVGSGAGFPALPMAAVSADNFPIVITALDATAKKLAHIDATASFAELDNITTVNGRAEELGRGIKFREKFDITTARAVAPLQVLLELTAPLTKKGGYFCAMKSHADEELAQAGVAAEKLGLTLCDNIRYSIPGGDARALLIYEKTAHTSELFPRRYAEITKNPLR